MQNEYPDRKFIFIADDWGSGIASRHAAKLPHRLDALVQAYPIAFDGYPVNEIQANGWAAEIPNTKEGGDQFALLFAAFDQTLVRILKSMVYDPAKFLSRNKYKWLII